MPLARIQRDFGLGKHFPLIAILGSVVFFGCAIRAKEKSLPERIHFKDFRVGERNC